MTRLDRYILAQLLRVFGFFALVLVAVAWANQAMLLFGRLVGGGQSFAVFFEFALLTLPILLHTVLPITSFVATIYVTVNLLRTSELTVAHAAGLSPFRLVRPVAVFGLVIGLFMAVLMHFLMPAANQQLARRQAEIAQNITSGLLQSGMFHHPATGLTVFISEITPEGTLRGIYLSDRRNEAQPIDYTARSALIVPERDGPKLVMIDGFAQLHDQATNRLFTTSFADFTYDLGALIGPAGRRRHVSELTTAELIAPNEALLQETRASPARISYELARRMLDPLMAPLTALIGFSVLIAARFSRLGFWRPVLVAALLLALLQLMINLIAQQALRAPGLAWLAATPAVVALGIVLTALALAARRRPVRHRDAATGAGQ